ncbi:hypothetical protein Angca_003363 [Angiostrongylus cantonensis]|nr:hypothetical protein Angca_003363 [Angiostrongylus cantonensis]
MIYFNVVLLLLWFTQAVDANNSLPNEQNCWFRCIAKCLHKNKELELAQCENTCGKYNDEKLCEEGDQECWDRCIDLAPQELVGVVTGFRHEQHSLSTVVSFKPIPDAVFYVVQYRIANWSVLNEYSFEFIREAEITNVVKMTSIYCDPVDIRVSAVTTNGVGPFSEWFHVGEARPYVSPKLQLVSMTYINESFVKDFYSANGTIEIVFRYEAGPWELESSDLEVSPVFHMVTCKVADLGKAVPVPTFKKGRLSNTIVGRVGSDMMYRDCRFLYYAQSIASVQCGTRTEVSLPPANSVQTLIINCDTVRSSPCRVPTVRQPPVCGQIDHIDYAIVGDVLDPYDANYSLTLNVTFKPFIRQNEPPTIYYKALYGEAIPYQRKEEEAFVGVNITNITGFSGNCLAFDSEGFCTEDSGNSVIVDSIHFDKLYGITFCAVKDVNNAELPDILAPGRIFKPRANKIFVKSPEKPSKVQPPAVIAGIIVGTVTLLVSLIIAFFCYVNKKQRKENRLYQLKLTQLEQEKGSRYIDFPKKHDIWEIERRNLIIFEEERLGSGAFGAVYLGKLLGKSCAHKNSNSPLGVNLMRAESCEVAVKMLPEYADDISRGEFLREIGLMKSLGYHERLVNMLACITESEPLCLVVEYCNDGDLLRFLRERCKYMLKLDANGVNYHEPPLDNNYDIDMVITLKQLLMFAVQISYGLEYISSKGFVHRDVAARNVLVHGKTSCKIGDFGLCRNLCTDNSHYKSKGGRLPVKWMSPEAIRHYEFSAQSDVWAFGVLLFEIITLGGSPYPSVPPEKMLPFLENGGRMERPDNCPENFYEVMCECWTRDPEKRPNFLSIRQKLAAQLEKITEEYSYLTLDARKDYYNFQYDDPKPDVLVIPETGPITPPSKRPLSTASTLSIESLLIDGAGDSKWSGDLIAETENVKRDSIDSTNLRLSKGVDNRAYKADNLE